MPRPYTLFRNTLTEGLCEYQGTFSTRQELDCWIAGHTAAPLQDLYEFLASTDFETEEPVLYGFAHAGSGMDRPAYKVQFQDRSVTCHVFDAQTQSFRTMDLRHSEYYFALKVSKSLVQSVKVTGPLCREPRVFMTNIGEDISTEEAVKVIKGFDEYAAQTDEAVLHSVSLTLRGSIPLLVLKALQNLPELRELYTVGVAWDDAMVNEVAKLTNLKRLRVGGWHWEERTNFKKKHLELLSGMNLEYLDMSDSDFSLDALRLSDAASDWDCEDDGASSDVMERYRARVRDETRRVNEGLRHVLNFTRLRDLRLGSAFPLDEHGAQLLAKHPSLRSIRTCSPSSAALAVLASSKLKLEELEVEGPYEREEMKHMMIAVGQCRDLVYLSVKGNVADEDVELVGTLTRLQHLALVGHNEITAAGLEHLQGLRQLRVLCLGYSTKITDDGLKHVLQLPLEKIDLRCTSITTAGVELLAKGLPGLQELNLRYARGVAEDAVTYLRSMHLQHLNVFGTCISERLAKTTGASLFSGDESFHDWGDNLHVFPSRRMPEEHAAWKCAVQ